jgi:hypothetical protein
MAECGCDFVELLFKNNVFIQKSMKLKMNL